MKFKEILLIFGNIQSTLSKKYEWNYNDKGKGFLIPSSKENICFNLQRIKRISPKQAKTQVQKFLDISKNNLKKTKHEFKYEPESWDYYHHKIRMRCHDDIDELRETETSIELKGELAERAEEEYNSHKPNCDKIYQEILNKIQTVKDLIFLYLIREISKDNSKWEISHKGTWENLELFLRNLGIIEKFNDFDWWYSVKDIVFGKRVTDYLQKLLSIDPKSFLIFIVHIFNSNSCSKTNYLHLHHDLAEFLDERLEKLPLEKIIRNAYEKVKSQVKVRNEIFEKCLSIKIKITGDKINIIEQELKPELEQEFKPHTPAISPPEPLKKHIKKPPPVKIIDIKIYLGDDEKNKEVFWELKKEKNWSFIIVGTAGTGKTQTVKSILSEFKKINLPYIIFDFRKDYISETNDSDFGKILDLKTISINPLDLDGDNSPKDQKYQISDIIDLVYNIGDRQVGYIRDAIKLSYEDKGINEEKRSSWKKIPPTFENIQKNLEKISTEGDSQTKSSIKGIFARLDPIFDYGIFSAETLLPFEEIMKNQTIVNLGNLPNENLKAVICEFFLRKLKYYFDKIGESREPRLYIVIDEAHRLKYEREASAGQLLKEARKYGVGLLLSTQDPKDFTGVVYNNIGGIISLQLTEPTYADKIAKQLGGRVTGKNIMDLVSKFSAYVKFYSKKDAIRFNIKPYFQRERVDRN
ncbi:MAG: ATP-binding protein [Candidatus Helarchaeota archaeon]